jgi:hypothetical protein
MTPGSRAPPSGSSSHGLIEKRAQPEPHHARQQGGRNRALTAHLCWTPQGHPKTRSPPPAQHCTCGEPAYWEIATLIIPVTVHRSNRTRTARSAVAELISVGGGRPCVSPTLGHRLQPDQRAPGHRCPRSRRDRPCPRRVLYRQRQRQRSTAHPGGRDGREDGQLPHAHRLSPVLAVTRFEDQTSLAMPTINAIPRGGFWSSLVASVLGARPRARAADPPLPAEPGLVHPSTGLGSVRRAQRGHARPRRASPSVTRYRFTGRCLGPGAVVSGSARILARLRDSR